MIKRTQPPTVHLTRAFLTMIPVRVGKLEDVGFVAIVAAGADCYAVSDGGGGSQASVTSDGVIYKGRIGEPVFFPGGVSGKLGHSTRQTLQSSSGQLVFHQLHQ